MKRTNLFLQGTLTLLTLAAMITVPSSVQSQDMPGQSVPQQSTPQQNMAQPDNDAITRQRLASFDNFLDNHPEIAEALRKDPSLINGRYFVSGHPELQQYLQQHPEIQEELTRNPGLFMHDERQYERSDRDAVPRSELAVMDNFLDKHPEIAEQLRRNPSLINDQQFVANHPALQQFLQQHTNVAQDYQEHPNAFMRDENSFDRAGDRDNNRGGDRDNNRAGDRDNISRRDLAEMDRFLDKHPEIAEQLRKNPSLIDDKQFVANHPALQRFIAEYHSTAAEFKENPNAFMRDENSFDRAGDRDNISRRDLSVMDDFLDKHPEIAERLRKNPGLLEDKQFDSNHPALQQFLEQHPQIAQAYKQDPSLFMRDENRFEQRENASNAGMGTRNNDVTRGELASFHEFLTTHDKIADALSKNPTLVNNKEFLENHTELREYLQSNPQVREEVNENPQAFVTASANFNGGMPKNTHTAKVNTETKPK